MLNEHIQLLKEAMITEFYRLYEAYSEDDIYACALVFDSYLTLDYLAVSTERSLFSETDEDCQYLAQSDRWMVGKWRYHSRHAHCQLTPLRPIFADYLKQTHIFGQPLQNDDLKAAKNNLDIFLDAFAQAKTALIESYGLNIDSTLFFISIPNQPKVEILSAQQLNHSSTLLSDFLSHKNYQPELKPLNDAAAKIKLGRSDKDLLTDLAQIILIEPYDYLEVAREAYLLTLEANFIDTNVYVQKLILTIASMDTQADGSCALVREEILSQIAKIQAPHPSALTSPAQSLFS